MKKTKEDSESLAEIPSRDLERASGPLNFPDKELILLINKESIASSGGLFFLMAPLTC